MECLFEGARFLDPLHLFFVWSGADDPIRVALHTDGAVFVDCEQVLGLNMLHLVLYVIWVPEKDECIIGIKQCAILIGFVNHTIVIHADMHGVFCVAELDTANCALVFFVVVVEPR